MADQQDMIPRNLGEQNMDPQQKLEPSLEIEWIGKVWVFPPRYCDRYPKQWVHSLTSSTHLGDLLFVLATTNTFFVLKPEHLMLSPRGLHPHGNYGIGV